MTFFASDHLNDLFPAHSSSQPHERGTTGAGVHSSTPAPVTVSTRGTDRPGARPISGHTAPGVWPAGENDMSDHFEDLNEEPNIHPPFWAFAVAIAVFLPVLFMALEYAEWGEEIRNSRVLPMISEGFGQ